MNQPVYHNGTLELQGVRLGLERRSETVLHIVPRGHLNNTLFHTLLPRLLSILGNDPELSSVVYVCIDLRLVTLETIHVRRRYIADFLAQGGLIKAILVYNYAESMSDLLVY